MPSIPGLTTLTSIFPGVEAVTSNDQEAPLPESFPFITEPDLLVMCISLAFNSLISSSKENSMLLVCVLLSDVTVYLISFAGFSRVGFS